MTEEIKQETEPTFLEKVKAEREALEKVREETKALISRAEQLKAEEIMSGKVLINPPEKKEEIDPKEYAKRALSGRF